MDQDEYNLTLDDPRFKEDLHFVLAHDSSNEKLLNFMRAFTLGQSFKRVELGAILNAIQAVESIPISYTI